MYYSVLHTCMRPKIKLPKSPPRLSFRANEHGFMNAIAAFRVLQLKANPHVMPIIKQWKRHVLMTMDPGMGLDVDNRVYHQVYDVYSYEIGPDGNATMNTLIKYVQETSLMQGIDFGLQGDGFGSTPEMSKKSLIWVVTKNKVVVDSYPNWRDVVRVDTWVAASGKNRMRRDCVISDCKTGDRLATASSICVMMNKDTRRISKIIPDEVLAEIQPFFVDTPPLLDDDKKLPKLDAATAAFVCNGITPKRSDLDVNQHVNNVKYADLVLEGVPQNVMEKYELASMTLEYRRECMMNSVVQSLTWSVDNDHGGSDEPNNIDFQHLLRFEGDGGEIVKGRTTWRPKSKK